MRYGLIDLRRFGHSIKNEWPMLSPLYEAGLLAVAGGAEVAFGALLLNRHFWGGVAEVAAGLLLTAWGFLRIRRIARRSMGGRQ